MVEVTRLPTVSCLPGASLSISLSLSLTLVHPSNILFPKLEKQLLVPLLLAARVSSKSHPSALQLPCRLRRFAGRSGGVIFVSLFVALSFQVSGHT